MSGDPSTGLNASEENVSASARKYKAFIPRGWNDIASASICVAPGQSLIVGRFNTKSRSNPEYLLLV
jgi:hypothetical protein